MAWMVVMGVAGSGKSSVGLAVARLMGLPLIEGDDFHPAENIAKLRAGIQLDDVDRAGWLDALAAQLAGHQAGAVLTCSALKRAYRDRLRGAVTELRFLFLDIEPQTAFERVAERVGHVFPPSLVASQFMTLESPIGEAGVLRIPAADSPEAQLAKVSEWLAAGEGRAPRSTFEG